MEEFFNQLVEQTGSTFGAITGITLPPIAIVLALILAALKGMKTLMKVACAALVIYIVWMLIQAGIIPINLA